MQCTQNVDAEKHVPTQNDLNSKIDEKHCYSCGKTFRAPAELIRHKNRKTPCVIQTVKPSDINNPLRCIYCNKISCNIGNLNRHLTTCKVKNGGMHILAEKTKHEQTDVKEELAKMQALIAEQSELLKSQAAKIEQLEAKPNVVNNNTQINNNVNIVFKSWQTPDFSSLIEKNEKGVIKFVDMITQHGVQLPMRLINTIWYNPAIPNNLSIYLVNKQTEETLCWDGTRWCITDSATVSKTLREKCYLVTDKLGTRLQKQLTANQQQIIAQCAVNRPDQQLTKHEIDQIKRAVYAGRALTKKHRGRITAG